MDSHDSELQVLMALDSGAQAQIIFFIFLFFLNHLAKQDFSLRTITFCFQNMKLLSKTGNQTASYKKIFIFLDGVPKCMIGKQFKYTNTI